MSSNSIGSPSRIHLDVRPVEPKERFLAIMAAYDALPAGSVLEMVVDHDPKCMYYTLQATRSEGEFRFEYLENGPETWRVEVTREHAPKPTGG
jgi:uncharacterized protein (DUF2249 family)